MTPSHNSFLRNLMSSFKAAYGFCETSLSCSGLSKRKVSFYSKKASTEQWLQQVRIGVVEEHVWLIYMFSFIELEVADRG